MTEERKGFAVLNDGRINKSVAFARQERKLQSSNRSPGHFYCNYFDGGGPARQA